MKFKQFWATSLALSMIASIPAYATEVDLDTTTFDSTSAVSFSDVSGHWGESFITDAVSAGIFAGNPDGTFNPEGTLSRVQFVVVMCQVAGLPTPALEEGKPWYYGYLKSAIMLDMVPSSFNLTNLGEDITREEMACMLIKTLGEENFPARDNTNVHNLPDFDSISSEYREYVNLAVSEGLLAGDQTGNISPNATVTRVVGCVTGLGAINYEGETITTPFTPANQFSSAVMAAVEEHMSVSDQELCVMIDTRDHHLFSFIQQANDNQLAGEFAIYTSATTSKVDTILVLNMSEVEGAEVAVQAAMEAQIAKAVAHPDPAQAALADSAVVTVLEDGTNIMVISQQAEAIAASVIANLQGTETPEPLYENELSKTFALAIDSLRTEDEKSVAPVLASSQEDLWPVMEQLLGFTAEDVEGFAVAISPMMVHAYAVIVVRPTEEGADKVLTGITKFQEQKMNDFENYLIDQYEIACNGMFSDVNGGTMLFVMAENTQDLLNELHGALQDESLR